MNSTLTFLICMLIALMFTGLGTMIGYQFTKQNEIYTKTIESNENIDKMIQELQEKFKFLANKTQIYLDLLNKNELLETLANDLSINLKNKIELLSHLISLLKLNITWYQKIEPLLVS